MTSRDTVWFGGCAVILLFAVVHIVRAVQKGRRRPAALVFGVVGAAAALIAWTVLMITLIEPLMMRGGHR